MENFVRYCKDYILENIDNLKDCECYACDIYVELCEEANVNGTLTYDRNKAFDYLHNWWKEVGNYWQYEKCSFGENEHNPFDDPEAYMVCMVMEGCSTILSKVPFIDDSWNEILTIDETMIQDIKDFVSEFDEWQELF